MDRRELLMFSPETRIEFADRAYREIYEQEVAALAVGLFGLVDGGFGAA